MALGTNQQTVTTGANFIPEIWSQETQRATQSNLVMARLVKRFDRDVLRKGDTIHVPIISNLTAAAKAANTQVSLSAPTEDKVDISINKHYQISFLVEDILDAQSQYDLYNEYQKKVSYGLAKQADTDIFNLYTSITQTAGTAGAPVTDPVVLKAIKYLDDADAPFEGRAFVMKPAVKAALLAIDKYVNSQFVGDMPVKTGLFGQRYGMPFYMSTNVPVDGSGYGINLIFQEEVYACAMQKEIKVESQRILEYLGTLTVGQVLYGVANYRNTFGCLVYSD